MTEQVLPFRLEWVSHLSELRNDVLTQIFRFISALGNVEGYLIIIALLFTVFNKRLGIYASLVALFTNVLNHLLKVTIKNPRPFVTSNEHLHAWGVSEHRAIELINEYSTPSGHAMTSAAFFGFLFLRIRNKVVRLLCVIMILGIGIARPYLGVHFVEDVLIGSVLGLMLAFLMHRTIEQFWKKWLSLSFIQQLMCVGVTVTAIWQYNNWIDPRSIAQYPQSFLSILGFLTGTLLAAAIEEKHNRFSLEDSNLGKNIGRFVLMILVLTVTLVGLDELFALLAEDTTLIGLELRYMRYFLVSIAGILFAPWLFIQMKLAKKSLK